MSKVDKAKVLQAKLGELNRALETLLHQRDSRLQNIEADQDHSELWKARERDLVAYEFSEKISTAIEDVRQIRSEAVSGIRASGDVALELYPFRATGAAGASEDAAIKGELRALASALPAESRKTFFMDLAAKQDWGRLGALLAVAPELAEEARALSLPDRDASLEALGAVRESADRILKAEHARTKEVRLQELMSRTVALNDFEAVELTKLGGEKEKGWPLPPTHALASGSAATPRESERYRALMDAADLRPLSLAEQVEALKIAEKMETPMP